MTYNIEIQKDQKLPLLRLWFLLAITSLAIAGLFSLPPAILRGPLFEKMFDTQHIFDIALVVHVNLSVLIWIITISCLLWNFYLPKTFLSINKSLFFITAFGTLLLVVSAFIPNTLVVKSNYVPMLVNPVFIIGLSLIFSGIFLTLIFYILASLKEWKDLIIVGLKFSAYTGIIAIICFILAGYKLTLAEKADPDSFYELLYWGGGHILQFIYSNLLMIAWLWLSHKAEIKSNSGFLSKKYILGLFILNFIFVLPTPLIYFYAENVGATIPLFTQHMQIFAGIVPSIFFLDRMIALIKHKSNNSQKAPKCYKIILFYSLIFFIYGCILGLFIKGMNTIVPAHYHAAVVGGLSLALMGVCYDLLGKLGFIFNENNKINSIQAHIYSIGHILHITGLAVMGGYGALRKTAAATAGIHTTFGKIMFFSGGPLALIGGILFIYIVYRSCLTRAKIDSFW